MAEVITRAETRADLLDIYAQGITQFGLDVADSYIDGIDTAMTRLADHPEIGPIYPGLRPLMRFLTYRSHHILYDYDGATVWIARILHHAMDVRGRV